MRTQCSECGATYSAAEECRICAQALGPAGDALLSEAEADRLRSAHASVHRLRQPRRTGSELIDIKRMSARLRAETPPKPARAMTLAPRSDRGLLLPAFAGGLDGLSAAPLLEPSASQPTSASGGAPRTRGPLHALLAVLTLGVLGLGAIVVGRELGGEDPPPQARVVAAQPSSRDDAPEPATPELDGADNHNNGSDKTEPSEPSDPPTHDEARAEAPNQAASSPRPRPRPSRPSTAKPSSPSATASNPAAPAPSKLGDDALVDCLLGSNSPACKAHGSTPAPSPKPPETSAEPLPNKLGQSEILAGIRPVKSAAKHCGDGVTVAVKFSVEGASGRVLSATPLDAHASSAVGACVAKAARAASFEAFASPRQGFTFKFRL